MQETIKNYLHIAKFGIVLGNLIPRPAAFSWLRRVVSIPPPVDLDPRRHIPMMAVD
jgi:hypothetical protein